ncbi:hypothetical protein ACR9E3_03825 [Actinomycetospora sp. C-140]
MTEPGGLGDKGSFSVDISQAPGAIRELEQARRELVSIRSEAQTLGQVNPPSRDQVSLDAAQALGLAGVGSPASFMQALDGGIQELSRMIDALRASFENYRAGDEQARSALSQQP